MQKTTANRVVLIFVTVFLAAIFGIPYAAFVNDGTSNQPKVEIDGTVYGSNEFDQRQQILQRIYYLLERVAELNDPLETQLRAARARGQQNVDIARDRLVNHMALLHLAKQSNIEVSREEVVAKVQELDQAWGGREKLRENLRESAVTEQQFLRTLGEVLTVHKLLAFVLEHELRPDYKGAFEGLARSKKTIDFRYVRLTRHDLVLDDEDVANAYRAFYDAQKKAFETPTTMMVEAIWSAGDDLRAQVRGDVSDGALRRLLADDTSRALVLERLEDGAGDKDKEGPTDDALLEQHRAVLVEVFVDREAERRADATWKAVERALRADPQASLRALAREHGLSFVRTSEPMTYDQLDAKDPADRLVPVADETFSNAVIDLEVGEHTRVPVDGTSRWLARALSRSERTTPKYEELTREQIERAAYASFRDSNRAEIQRPARVEIEWVGTDRLHFAAPITVTTAEIEAFYDAHKARLFTEQLEEGGEETRPLAEVRGHIEELLTRGKTDQQLEAAVARVREEAAEHAPEAPEDGEVEVDLTPEQLVAKHDLAAAAARAGLRYFRLSVTESELDHHPLVGTSHRETLGLSDESTRPGMVSAVKQDGERDHLRYFVRLLRKREGGVKSFDEARETVRELLLREESKKQLAATADRLRNQLVDSGFAAEDGRTKTDPPLAIEVLTGVAEEGDLKGVATDERARLWSAVWASPGGGAKLGKDKVSTPVLAKDRDVAFICQGIAEHTPEMTTERIRAFEIRQMARVALTELFNNRIQGFRPAVGPTDPTAWFQPLWYGTVSRGGANERGWVSTYFQDQQPADREENRTPGGPRQVPPATPPVGGAPGGGAPASSSGGQ